MSTITEIQNKLQALGRSIEQREHTISRLRAEIDTRMSHENKIANIRQELAHLRERRSDLIISERIFKECEAEREAALVRASKISGEIDGGDERLILRTDEIGLSRRAANYLYNTGGKIDLVGSLVQMQPEELLRIREFGRKSLREIEEKLSEMGLKLGMQVSNWPPPPAIDDGE